MIKNYKSPGPSGAFCVNIHAMTSSQFTLIAKCGIEGEKGPVLNAQSDITDHPLKEIAKKLIETAGWYVEECSSSCSPKINCTLRNLATSHPDIVVNMILNQLGALAGGKSDPPLLP